MPDIAQAIKELPETAIVMSGIRSRQAGLPKDHAQWLQKHDRRLPKQGSWVVKRMSVLPS